MGARFCSNSPPSTTQTTSLPPNDDAREKEAARRRRSATGDGRDLEADLGKGAPLQQQAVPQPPRAPALDAAAVAALYQNCLKLASENKITAKNTWALPLIDHMADLVASDAAARGGATDFARASLTLAAGVSIYAHRVDAVHGDVFRILGGLGRAAGDDDGEEEEAADGENDDNNDDATAPRRRRRPRADADPASTLEPDTDINAKKFDLAFAVDPLFQRTAARFDGGAAGGLLLNSLPFVGGPCLAFDSALVPDDVPSVCGRRGGGKPLAEGPAVTAAAAALATIEAIAPSAPLTDLAAAAGCPEAQDAGEAAALVQAALADVDAEGVDVEAVEEDDDEEAGETAEACGDAATAAAATTKPDPDAPAPAPVDDAWTTAAVAAAVASQSGLGGGSVAPLDDDDDDGLSLGAFGGDLSDDGGGGATRSRTPLADAPSWIAGGGGGEPATPTRSGTSSSSAAADALRWLIGGGGDGDAAPPPTGGKAAWAGATHWRHRAARLRPLMGASEDGGDGRQLPPATAARPPRRRADPLDFASLPPLPASSIKRAPLRDTTLRAARARADTLLPDDVHYSPSALGALFLAPELGAATAAALASAASPTRRAADSDDDSDGGGLPAFPSDDDEAEEGVEGALAAGLAAAPATLAWGADPSGPAPAARLAPAAPVAYSRSAKRVDVRALKEALWEEARAAAAGEGDGTPLRLSDLVPRVATGAGAAAAPSAQLSPHLVFICLLHLCNEHGLELGRQGDGPVAAGAAAVRLGGGADVSVVGVPAV